MPIDLSKPEIDDGGPANAIPGCWFIKPEKPVGSGPPDQAHCIERPVPGFSKLEACAMAAMAAIIQKDKWRNPFTPADIAGIAVESFGFAEAMLREYNRRVKGEK